MKHLLKFIHYTISITLLCLMREIAVTRVSIALAYSPAAASETALAIALLDTVLFLLITSSNSWSLIRGVAANGASTLPSYGP